MFHQTIKKKKSELSFIANVSCSIKTQLCFLLLSIKQTLIFLLLLLIKTFNINCSGKASHNFSEYSNGFKIFSLMTHILLLRLIRDHFFNSSPTSNVRAGKVCNKGSKGSPQIWVHPTQSREIPAPVHWHSTAACDSGTFVKQRS